MQHILIEHAGVPGSRRGEALVRLGRDVPTLPSLQSYMPTPNIAKKVLYDIAPLIEH